jgi:Putative beta-barrel porin 2
MSGLRKLVLRTTSGRMRSLAFCLALSTCLFGHLDPASAQATSQPPLDPPQERPLASGSGMLSVGQWLLSPTLDLYTLYDSNIQGSATNKLSGSGFRYDPALRAELDTGLYDTKIYGSFDGITYPTQPGLNTFNRQAGASETYAPLRDLSFTTQIDYTHATNAAVTITSIPTPVVSPVNPAPEGAAGVVASQQSTVNPNDTYTATVSAYKEFNRAFLKLGSSVIATQYEMTPTSNFYKEIYNGGGGFWFTPQLYAFADANDANFIPAVGPVSNSYLARGGIGSGQIGLFQGSIYYGQQGTAVDQNGGTAGGDIYGGSLTYLPTAAWTMSVSVDRFRNRSDITATNVQGLSGLGLSAVGVSAGTSAQVTTIAYRSDYTLTAQASAHLVVSDTRIAESEPSIVNNSWLASAGINYRLRDDLSFTLDYSYTRYISEQPLTSLNKNLVTLGAHHSF